MKQINFDGLKNIKTPEEWIEKAVAIPETVEKESAPVPFWRNRALVTAASLVLVSVLSLLVYLSFGMKPPVEVKPSTPATEIIWSTDENGATVASEIVVVTDGDSSRDGTQSTEPRSILEQIIDNIFGTGDTSSTTASGSRRGGSTGSHAGTGHGSDTDDTGSSRTDPTTSSNPGESDMFDPTTKTDPTERGKPDPTTKTNPTEGGKTDPTTQSNPTEGGKTDPTTTSLPTEGGKTDPTTKPDPVTPPVQPTEKPTEASEEPPTVLPWEPGWDDPTEAPEVPTSAPTYPRTIKVQLSKKFSGLTADSTVYVSVFDSSGNRLGDSDPYSSQHVAQISVGAVYVTVSYTPADYGILPKDGTYRYEVYNGSGRTFATGTKLLSAT